MTIEEKIKTLLSKNLHLIILNIKNESALHSGSKGAETHFRIEIVSKDFMGKKILERHRFVQEVLKNELLLIKAFSLHAFTPEEWENKKGLLEKSPSCRGSHDS